MAILLGGGWILGVAIPGIAVTAFLCARYPVVATIGAFLSAGAFGTLSAFTPLSGQKVADLLLLGLWLAAIWGWLLGGRRRAAWIWPGIVVLCFYIALTAAEIVAAPTITIGFQSFRASIWYAAAVPLLAYAPWSDATRRRMLRAAVAALTLVAAYATFRWAVGPAGEEREQARQIANNFLDGKLRPVGSFSTSKELAAWVAMTTPFAAGLAMAARGRLRLMAVAAAGLSVVAMLAADVRAGPSAAVPGVVAAIVLYQLSQAFRGHRGPTVAIAVAAAVLGGAGAFALTLGDKSDSGTRYHAILDPESDSSYQARLVKWRTALDDIDRAPFGHGLGTTGPVQVRYGEFRTIGSVDVDNSYLKIAFEQGFVVMALFVIAILMMLGGLARRALVSLDPARAGPAIAACGTLVSMLVLFFIGGYIEGLPVLGAWICVGLGVMQFTGPPLEGEN